MRRSPSLSRAEVPFRILEWVLCINDRPPLELWVFGWIRSWPQAGRIYRVRGTVWYHDVGAGITLFGLRNPTDTPWGDEAHFKVSRFIALPECFRLREEHRVEATA